MVEIIPKKIEKRMLSGTISLFVAGALLAVALLGYVFLVRFEAQALSTREDFEGEISKVGTKTDKETEIKIRNYERKIKDLAILTGASAKSSQFFNNFEDLIHPKVIISSIDLDVAQGKASLKGSAADFQTLEQQLIFLKSKTNFIEAVDLSHVGMGEDGGADFELNLTLSPEIFNTAKE